jgi:PAS domain S-box-containing protein
LLTLTMTGILLVGLIPLAVTSLRRGQFREEMLRELDTLAESECSKVATDVYLMLRAQHEKLKKEVRHDLNVAEYILNESGGLGLSQERVRWTATNQFSGKTVEIELPKALLGERWIERNANAAVPSPVVDNVRELLGARCTIFQRMNESGDLLRVCTNVLKKDGTRAIGTFIPAREPDGTPDPVVAAVMRGQTYVGRAYVVDDWYLTAYEPLFNSQKKVIGALFCGVRLEDIPELRKGIVDTTVGNSGYTFVLGGSGTQKGRYIISRHGRRDGENIYDTQDAAGNYFVRSIIEEAMKTKDGNCHFMRYEWQNPGDATPREKVIATTYFEPWDWVIGAGVYRDDFHAAMARVDDAASRLLFWGLTGAFLAFALCGVLAWVESGRIAAMNREITERKTAEARQERMLQRLERLNALQEELVQPGPLVEKLKKITDCAVAAFELDFCRIWHVEPGDLCTSGCACATATEERHSCKHREACLHLLASSGRYTHIDGDHRRVPLGCYKIGRVASGDESRFLTNDLANDPRIHNHEWAKGLGLVSFAGYKLGDTHGHPIGVLAMFATHAISEEDDALLANLADMTSAVILASQTEEAIRSSEAKYKMLYDASGDALMYSTADAVVYAGNAAAIRLFGCKDEKEFASLSIADLSSKFQPDGTLSSLKAKEMIAIAIERGSHLFEWRHRRVDGSEFPATVVLSKMELDGRTVVLGAVRDITPQKEAESALRESERRLANIIDFLPDATFAIDRAGKVIAWNRAMEEMTDVPAEEMLGQGDYTYAVPFYGERRPMLANLLFRDDKEIEEHYHSVVRKGEQLIAESVSPKVHGGGNTCLWVVASPLYDSDGRLVGAIESIRDVTEQRWTQEELRRSEQRFMDVLHASSDAMVLSEGDKFVDCNDAAARMLGYPSRDAFPVLTSEQISPPLQPDGRTSAEKAKEMGQIAIQQGTHHFEWIHRRLNGEDFPVEVTLTSIVAQGRNQLLCVWRDITEQKRAEKALRDSERSYRLLAENIRDVVWSVDFSGVYTYLSPSTEQLLGIKWQEGMTITVDETLAPGSRELAKKLLADVAANRGETQRLTAELELLRADGSTVWVEATGGEMRDESGKVVGILGVSRDITERKRTEEVLHAYERRIRFFAENVSDVIWSIDKAGVFTYLSPAVERMLGFKWDERKRVLLGDIVAPACLPTARETLRSIAVAAESGQTLRRNVELELLRADGTTLWGEVNANPLFDESGQLAGFLGTTRDINDRRKAEEALRSSERRYRLLADNLRDVVGTMDFSGRLTYLSPSAEQLFGYTAAEVVQMSLDKFMTAPSYALVCNFLKKAAAAAEAGQPISGETLELEGIRKDGSSVMTEVAFAGMYDESGRMVAIQGVCRDITSRKQAEAERTLTTQRMESLLALSHIANQPADEIIATVVEDAIRMTQSTIGYLALMNEDESVLTIRYWSRSVHAVCEVIDEPIDYPIESTGLWGEAVRQRQPVVTNDYAAPNPLKRGIPEGHVPVVRHMNIPIFDGRRIVAIAGVGNKPTDYDERDLRQLQLLMEGWWRIAKQKQYEENLAVARDDAQTANRAKSRFLATMSHEIRTPMTAILGYTDLLMDPMLTPTARDSYVATIRRSGEHLLDLINDILDLSKIEAGKMSLSMERCNLVSLLADVASVVRPRAEQRGVTFSVEYPTPIPESIMTDRARLRQTIINLAGNAAKFTEKGAVRIVASFLPDGCKDKPAVQIEVIDTGIGIAKDVLPQLFRPFSQGDASVTQKYGGTGLGLAISHQLAEMLGGTLSVVSRLGRGSTFTLVVPTGDLTDVAMLENPSEAMQEDRQRAWAAESHDLSGVRVLLAEDGFDNRELIRTILQRAGITVETAINGQLAVQKGCETPFDLILMDMNMPEMDGYEATSLLRKHGYKGPIVALTANAMVGDSQRCRSAGCNEYLAKPIDRKRLIQTIATLVDTQAVAARVAAIRKTEAATTASSAAEGATAQVAEETAREPVEPQAANRETAPGHETNGERELVLVSEFYDDPDVAPLIRPFVERLAGQLTAMRKALDEHDHEELRRMAHKLKGAGGSYGFRQLTDVCRVLEDAARAHDSTTETAALDTVAAVIHAVERGCLQTA